MGDKEDPMAPYNHLRGGSNAPASFYNASGNGGSVYGRSSPERGLNSGPPPYASQQEGYLAAMYNNSQQQQQQHSYVSNQQPFLFSQKLQGSMPDMGYALQGAATSMMPSANSVMAQQQAMVHHSSGLLVGAGGGKQIVGPIGPHYQKQLDQANLSRSMASQHYHTRLATTAARNANSSSHHSKDKGGDSPNNSAGTLLVIGDTPSQANFGRVSVSKWSALDIGGIGLVSLSRDLYRYSFLTALYLNHNNLAYLSPEIGKLQSLVILDLSGNKLTTLPPEIGFVTALQELWLFDNQITYLPNEIGQLYQLEFLGIEGNMFGDPLEALVHKEGTQAAIAYLRDTMPVKPMPAEREWIQLEDDTTDAFTIMCYNTLAEKYATPQIYAYTPSWALAWSYRKDLLLQDILNYSADIVCLQEVEAGQYEEFFLKQLSTLGEYAGVFYPKSRSRTMSEQDKRQVDGCAIFYKSTKFKLCEKHVMEFQQLAMQKPDLRETEDAFNRVMVKDNIAVVALLEKRSTGQRYIVANAHLHWDPAFKDVKLLQSAMLLEEIQRLTGLWSTKTFRTFPVIITGDLNSLPDSGVVEFLTHGSIAHTHDDLAKYQYGHYTTRGISHKLSLKSAYAQTDALDFTNFTPTFKGIIDYIWYTTTDLVVCGSLAHVDRDYIRQTVGFPNAHHPSDHIPLVVSLKSKRTASAGAGS